MNLDLLVLARLRLVLLKSAWTSLVPNPTKKTKWPRKLAGTFPTFQSRFFSNLVYGKQPCAFDSGRNNVLPERASLTLAGVERKAAEGSMHEQLLARRDQHRTNPLVATTCGVIRLRDEERELLREKIPRRNGTRMVMNVTAVGHVIRYLSPCLGRSGTLGSLRDHPALASSVARIASTCGNRLTSVA